MVPLLPFLLLSGPAFAGDETHAPPPLEPDVVEATLPPGVQLPAAQADPALALPADGAPPPAATGPQAGNVVRAGAAPAAATPAAPAAAAPAAPAAPPAGWTPAGGGSPAGWTRTEAPQPAAAPPPAAPASGTPAGWTPVGGTAAPAAVPGEPATQDGWKQVGAPSQDESSVAVGLSAMGAAIVGVDMLVRTSNPWTFDAGLAVRQTRVDGFARPLLQAGLTFQPGQARSRHGAYARVGAVPDSAEGGEVLGTFGYAWRMLPGRTPLSFSVEVGPAWMAALDPDPGEAAAWLMPYVRVGSHFWLR